MIKKLTFILLAAGCTQIMYAQSTEKNEKFLENKRIKEAKAKGECYEPEVFSNGDTLRQLLSLIHI